MSACFGGLSQEKLKGSTKADCNDNPECIKILMNHGCNKDLRENKNNHGAIHVSAYSSALRALNFWLDYYKDNNVFMEKDGQGMDC